VEKIQLEKRCFIVGGSFLLLQFVSAYLISTRRIDLLTPGCAICTG